jgi:hypothetical protein
VRTAAFALLIFSACLVAASTRATRAEPTPPYLEPGGPVIIADRLVCSLINSDAADAGIVGQDGGASLTVDATQYFYFGDTLRTDGVIISNNVATSVDTDASDCIEMDHLQADGLASPVITALPGEMTVWPLPFTSHDGSIYFGVASVPGPSPWVVRGVGLGKLDLATMTSTRLIELMWDESSGFGDTVLGISGAVDQPDGRTYLFLHTSTNRVLLARIEPSRAADASAYEFWDGTEWRADPAPYAGTLWTQSDGFNGATVRWSEPLGKWVAMYQSVWGSFVRVRTADALTGPWSGETEWIDCSRWVAEHLLPKCYAGTFQPQFDRDGGRTMYITLSSLEPYEVTLHEIRLGAAIYAWRNAGGELRLQPQSPGQEFSAEGIAFYASDVPVPGFNAIHRWLSPTGESTYAAFGPTGATSAGIAFYAPPRPELSPNVDLDPVYRWDKGSERMYSPAPGWEALGYTRGPAVFYAVCGDADMDQLSTCAELAGGTDPLDRDSDGDGFGDRPATTANPNTNWHRDNCPLVYNPSQANGDGEPWGAGVALDGTHPIADTIGDACDDDLDNDGLTNDEEAALGTDPLHFDTDRDGWPDGVETACGSDPLNKSARPAGIDTDRDGVPDACELIIGSSPFHVDTDFDGLNDILEVRWGTDPRHWDSDGDGISDVCEVASVNLDSYVNTIDLMLIARSISTESTPQTDVNRDSAANYIDLATAAGRFGKC